MNRYANSYGRGITRALPAGVREIDAGDNATPIRIYESLSQFFDTEATPLAQANWNPPGAGFRAQAGFSGHRWDAGVTPDQALSRARLGDPGVTARVDAITRTLNAGIAPVERRGWRRDVMGSRVVVPDYLAGSPTCMRRRVRDTRAARHVKIVVEVACSAGVSSDTMLARGAAILALLERLQSEGIECDVYMTCSVDAIQVIPIPSRPLDISQSGFVLAHPAFARHVLYGVDGAYGRYTGAWAPLLSSQGDAGWERAIRAKLDLAPTDITIPRAYLLDELVNEPKRWIEARVSQLTDNAA